MPWSKKTKYRFLLISLIFIQIISIVLSALQDRVRHEKYSTFVNFKSPNYWAWFFTWWSFWTALFTIVWAIYKLASNNKQTYFSQLFDTTIVISNIISGVIFTIGWILFGLTKGKKWEIKLISPPHRSLINEKILSSFPFVTVQQTWIFYNVAVHIVAPLLVVYFFWQFSQVNLLEKKLTRSLLLSSLNPTIYFLYVIARAKIDRSGYPKLDKITMLPSQHPADFPPDYPFGFFHRWVGNPTSKKDNYKWKNSLISRTLWIIATLVLTYLTFSLLTYYLIKLKSKKSAVYLTEKKNYSSFT